MISSILVWLLIAFESAVFGNALLSFLQPRFETSRSNQRFQTALIIGFIAIITFASYLSLFFPLSSYTSLIFLGVTVFVYFLTKPLPRFSKPNKWLLVSATLILLFVLETATRRPLNSDTNLYHAQAIHWIESYPAVFGLGNLHGRLAFNSVWFVANAFYSFGTVLGRSLHLMSGLYFLFFSVFAFSFINKKQRYQKLPVAAAFLLLACFQYLASDISSPGTDVPAALSVWLVFLLTLQDLEEPSPLTPFVVTALAAFAIVIKLSAIVVMLIPAGYFARALLKRNYRFALGQAAIAALILTPFQIRNLIQSGYLVYPFPGLDLFAFSWKVPLERVIEEKNAILVWGRLPKLPIQEVLAMPTTVWLPKWFDNLTLARKVLVSFAAASPVIALFNHFVLKTRKRNTLLHAAFSIGVYFWLLSTPDIRFGYSFLIPTVVLNVLPLLVWLIEGVRLKPTQMTNILIASLGLFIGFTFIRSIEFSTLTDRILLPRDYDRVKTQACTVDGAPIFCSVEYNACSYHSFPCVPQQKDWVKRLGPNLSDGFFGEK